MNYVEWRCNLILENVRNMCKDDNVTAKEIISYLLDEIRHLRFISKDLDLPEMEVKVGGTD